mmetsp:Transcript_10844/g.19825  ORF Transcript_10844/g.19825 Transcript_10844/m.19825 type:complete len:222 (+) Transcript_10844:119-784(+)
MPVLICPTVISCTATYSSISLRLLLSFTSIIRDLFDSSRIGTTITVLAARMVSIFPSLSLRRKSELTFLIASGAASGSTATKPIVPKFCTTFSSHSIESVRPQRNVLDMPSLTTMSFELALSPFSSVGHVHTATRFLIFLFLNAWRLSHSPLVVSPHSTNAVVSFFSIKLKLSSITMRSVVSSGLLSMMGSQLRLSIGRGPMVACSSSQLSVPSIPPATIR